MTPLNQRIADAALRLSFAALSPPRQARAIWCVQDFLGCVLGGADRPEMAAALLLAHPGEIAVPGQAQTFDMPGAALVFGVSGALLQLHDLYPSGSYHPCLGVVSAAWAAWRQDAQPVEAFLDAVVAGYEVANRLGDVLAMAQIARGFTPTATLCGLGATVAAGRLLGLDRTAMAAALGNATLTCPATPFQALSDHGNAVPLHGGLAASGGVQAARLAQLGWSAGTYALEGLGNYPGWLRAMGGDVDALTPETWDGGTLDGVAWKLFPACGAAHMAIEAALQLPPLDPNAIKSVEIRLPGASMLLGGRGPRPDGELYDSIMSTRWSVCTALAHHAYNPATILRFDAPDPARDTLIHRSAVLHDPELDSPGDGGLRVARLVVQMTDGAIHDKLHRRQMTGETNSDPRRGSMGAPDDHALSEKFKTLTARHRDTADHLVAALRHAALRHAA